MITPASPDLVSIIVIEVTQRLAQIRRCLTILERERDDRAAIEDLMRRFHALAGIGNVEGINVMPVLSGSGEEECRALLAAGEAPNDEALRRWRGTLYLIEHEIEKLARRPPAKVAAEPIPPRRGSSVLLIDDDAVTCVAVGAALSDHGFAVRTAETREAAIRELDLFLPDLVIADVHLPDGTGFEVIEHLRAMTNGAAVAAFGISAATDFFDKVEGIRCGADAHFSKPVDISALVRRFRDVSKVRHTGRARILSVEDDAAQAEYLRSVLESAGHEVRTCEDPRYFETELVDFQPDLILMDVLLPSVSGYDLARFARQQQELQAVPILFLTTESQMNAKIDAVSAGGDDHLVKPVTPTLLLASVRARLERSKLIRNAMSTDSLTGLLNRAAFERQVGAAIKRHRGGQLQSAIMMVDIDWFKRINDTRGHLAGDSVILSCASLLRSRVRPTDAVCRFGGEEFALLISDLDETDAERLADRLRAEFAELRHRAPGGVRFQATFSAGVAAWQEGTSIEDWIEAADRALYTAKRSGRNCVVSAPRAPRASPTLAFSRVKEIA
jgi:diguanylate cyclase (GGDEF)-like protein